ncbi:PREDICTED: carcinoembryonic antigen-related cell adhesion molecule 8-like [Galeopterus variegatus]|uniref:Carcinoembryonic antigen-related cell adhesion molecule 8-like n=1 Tax=Galeopterus variegatus TaxID=482537 RepID=A0ABM0PZ15_GALVR|nr:PREDICTED: carcinoembryonic antigen-related cell adhesion molecule 8-like [Galeopterus variegatus]
MRSSGEEPAAHSSSLNHSGPLILKLCRQCSTVDSVNLCFAFFPCRDQGSEYMTEADPAHRQHIPRQSLLLTASLVTFWNPPTTAQLTMESVPFNAAEGKDVQQFCPKSAREYSSYVWYKGKRVGANLRIVAYIKFTQKNTPEPSYSSQKTLFPNRSLLFHNITIWGPYERRTQNPVSASHSEPFTLDVFCK